MRIVRFTVDLGPVRELRLRRPTPRAAAVERVTTAAPTREPGAVVPAPVTGPERHP